MSVNMNLKIDALRDYKFELVIENESSNFFSEKLIDSFLCGCIPIYWDNSNNSSLNVFNIDGIIKFSSIDDLIHIINDINNNVIKYEDFSEAIIYNFEEAKQWVSMGDVLWRCGLSEIFNK
jgi:hypothetical protein